MRRIGFALGFGLALATSIARAEPAKIALKIDEGDARQWAARSSSTKTTGRWWSPVDVWYHVWAWKDEPLAEERLRAISSST